MESFTNIAPYYDLLMQEVPYKEWLVYYQDLLKRNKLDPDSFLDLCCGTGVLSELLAERGKRVEGLDFSKWMIEEAKMKAIHKELCISYHWEDATSFDLGCCYDAVFSFFDSLNYILSRESLGSCFQCVFNHLNPGGSFIFDLNTVYAFESNSFDQDELGEEAPMQYLWKGNYFPEERLMKVHMDFWVDGKHFKEIHTQRAHNIAEVCVDLENVGFHTIQCYQSYSYKKPSKYSDRVHIVAFK